MAKKAANDDTAGTEVSLLGLYQPTDVVSDPKTWEMVEQKMKDVLASMPTDVSTAKARDVIRAGAMQFTTSKAAVDKARLSLTKFHRDEQKRINDEGGAIIEKIAGYAARARLPLTEWETAETERQDKISAVRKFLIDATVFQSISPTSAQIVDRLNEVSQYEMPGIDVLEEEQEILLAKRTSVIIDLKAARDRALVSEENDRKLAALQKKQDDRDFADAVLQCIKDAKVGLIGGKLYPYAVIRHELSDRMAKCIENEVAEAHQDDLELERREALEFIEKVHKAEQIKSAEAENARAEQAVRDAAEAAGRQAAEDARLAADKRLADQQAAHQAQLDQIAADKAAADAEAQRVADEEAARRADVEHQKAIMRAAVRSILEVCVGIEKELAVDIVVAIANGQIAHLEIKF